MNIFLIAEIGINHNGDINVAKKLIDIAKMVSSILASVMQSSRTVWSFFCFGGGMGGWGRYSRPC